MSGRKYRELFPERIPHLGRFKTGRLNAITDVPGVRVGHATVRSPRKGFLSGVTAIWPRSDVFTFRPRASGYVLHGAGEMTGLHQTLEWGLIETPILLTSTLNIGRVYDATVEYLARKYPRMGVSDDVLIPVVAECDDSFLNRARVRPVGPSHVKKALDQARAKSVVAEGSVGAGAGMISFGYKGGIGTSSRVISLGNSGRGPRYTLGVLVNANVGVKRQLRLPGAQAGKRIGSDPRHTERSIIVVIATDAPLRADQLRRICVRAGLGLGRVGSYASHGSGEMVLGFSTSLGEPRRARQPVNRVNNLHDSFLNPFYEATVECVEESVLNAIFANRGTTFGRDAHRVDAI